MLSERSILSNVTIDVCNMKKANECAGLQEVVGKYTDLIQSSNMREFQREGFQWVCELGGCALGTHGRRVLSAFGAGLVAWRSLSVPVCEMGPRHASLRGIGSSEHAGGKGLKQSRRPGMRNSGTELNISSSPWRWP